MNYTKINIDELWKRRIEEDFLEFQKKDIHTDITLACGDGAIRAHKLVLASFSSLLANILKDVDAETCIYFPELSISYVSFFIKAVYSGKLPSNDMGLQAVMIVNQAFGHVGTGCKNEKSEYFPVEVQKDCNISKADTVADQSTLMDSLDVNEMETTPNEVSEPKGKLKSTALSMTHLNGPLPLK